MTAPRPFAEYAAALKKHIEDDEPFEVILPLIDARALLSRLASREAVFEAAAAYLSDAHDCNDDEPCPHYDALSAAIEAARALDAATPQGEEG